MQAKRRRWNNVNGLSKTRKFPFVVLYTITRIHCFQRVSNLILSRTFIHYQFGYKEKLLTINIAIHKSSMCQDYVSMILCGEYWCILRSNLTAYFMGQVKVSNLT